MSRENTNRGYYSKKRKRREEKLKKRRAEPRIKHMKKDAVERAAESIINYMKERGYIEFPKIVTRYYNQRGNIYLNFKILKKDEKIIDCENRDLIQNLDEIPFPDFSDFSKEHPETFYTCVVELLYDWPQNKTLRDKIHEEVRTLVRKLRDN